MAKVLCMGESLLRLSTSQTQKLRQISQLQAVFGGAEANVAINLAQLDHLVSYATKLPQNDLSKNILFQLKGHNIETDSILFDADGRLGTYYLEVGAGLRASKVIYDRANSSIAAMTHSQWNLDSLFDQVTHFHTSGITLGLSPFWHHYLVEIVQYAHDKGITISFDMNYRAGLWSAQVAKESYLKILPFVDVLSANRLDAKIFMDLPVEDHTPLETIMELISQKYPQLKVIFGTNRESITPNSYQLEGFYYESPKRKLTYSKKYHISDVVDRVGGGDAFAAGILDGYIADKDAKELVEFATAASVLKHTVFGDANQFTRQEIQSFMTTSGGNIIR